MFRKAKSEDLALIEKIAQSAINSLKEQHIDQWNNGYPNRAIFLEDIKQERGFLFEDVAYVALIFDSDPNYLKIDGAWHYEKSYVALHRTMVLSKAQHKGLGYKLFLESEDYVKKRGLDYLRIDTHEDNFIMRRLLEKLDYRFCGTITLLNDAGKRLAFDKKLQ